LKPSEDLIKVFKVTLDGFGSYIVDDLGVVIDDIENSEVGDKFIIKVIKITREQFDKLPEFEGW
jgi:hypothetical protein